MATIPESLSIATDHHRAGRLQAAEQVYRQILAAQPDQPDALHFLGVVCSQTGRHEIAVEYMERAIACQGNDSSLHNNLGEAYRAWRRPPQAAAHFRRALELNPDFAEAHYNLGNALKDQGYLEEAVACYRRAVELRPGYAKAHNNLGNALRDQGNLPEALDCYRRALDLKPDFAEAHANLGCAWEETGDLTRAEESFRAALRHDPHCAFAHLKLAELLGGRLPATDLAEQRRLLAENALPEADRMFLHFGLGRVLDAQGMYAEAAAHLEQANALQLADWQNRGQEYGPQEHDDFVARMIAACTPEFFQRSSGFGVESDVPVFIVGLPRSGTTLVEQILASHLQVFGAGEFKQAGETILALEPRGDPIEGMRRLDRPLAQRLASMHLERLRQLAPPALRIVDKTPDNYLYLGLWAVLFPRARLIHCRRDLRDVAVSCWMTHFREIRWANDPQHIASRFRAYQQIMAHWRRVMPLPLFEVDYEETVTDLEGVARRLVAWLGLEWDNACLHFHRAQRPVRTASAVQVRQPVYRTSVGRWKGYEDDLPWINHLQ
jgi:tetratricopeptide (TPR) repeat protein